MPTPNYAFDRKIMFFILLTFFFVWFLSAANSAYSSEIVVPAGLSDTAFDRAFDNALEDASQNTDIKWNAGYDTPTEQQVFQLFMNFSTFDSSDTGAYDAKYDTRTIKRSDVPVDLLIIEEFDSTTQKLLDYKKKLELSD